MGGAEVNTWTNVGIDSSGVDSSVLRYGLIVRILQLVWGSPKVTGKVVQVSDSVAFEEALKLRVMNSMCGCNYMC
jgi:hypothetical protein